MNYLKIYGELATLSNQVFLHYKTNPRRKLTDTNQRAV